MYKISKIVTVLFFFLNIVYSVSAQAIEKTPNHGLSIEEAILIDVNIYRKKHHLTPLTMNAQISKQAHIHSQNMAQHKLPFGHTNFLNRIKVLRKEIKNSGAGAENVAFNYKDAHDVVKNWLLSPGHKKNIVGNYNLTGIGVARNAQGKIYFTQMFLKTGAAPVHAYRGRGQRTSVPHFSLAGIPLNSIFRR
jgi:uncharacterized protein YkwD